MTNEIKQAMQTQPKRVKARIKTYNGGRYGRSGEYIAIIVLEYFKNGNFKKSKFRVIEKLETIKKEYGCDGCNHTETIVDILDILS